MRKRLLIPLLGLCIAHAGSGPGVASASEPAGAAAVPPMVAGAAPERRPVLCTAAGCWRAPSAGWSFAAGFGLAVATAAALRRRLRA